MATSYVVPAIADLPAIRGRPRLAVVAAVAIAGLVTTLCSFGLALASAGASGVQVVLLEWISVPYIVAGLIAWWRRPDSRLGVLMVAGGFATGLSALGLARRLASSHGRSRLRHPAGRPVSACLSRVSGRPPAVELRAGPRDRRLRGRGRPPAREDVARRCRRRESARDHHASGGSGIAWSRSSCSRSAPCAWLASACCWHGGGRRGGRFGVRSRS